MNEMLTISVCYFVVAWLACWAIDLVASVARGPRNADVVIKAAVVIVCLLIVLMKLSRAHWLW